MGFFVSDFLSVISVLLSGASIGEGLSLAIPLPGRIKRASSAMASVAKHAH